METLGEPLWFCTRIESIRQLLGTKTAQSGTIEFRSASLTVGRIRQPPNPLAGSLLFGSQRLGSPCYVPFIAYIAYIA